MDVVNKVEEKQWNGETTTTGEVVSGLEMVREEGDYDYGIYLSDQ